MPSRDFCAFPHTSPNVHAVFERQTLKFRTRVLYAPGEPLTIFFFRFLFRLKCGIPYDPTIPKKYKNTNIWRRRKRHALTVRQGHVEHVRKISGSILHKRRRHWALNEGNKLEPACRRCTRELYAMHKDI